MTSFERVFPVSFILGLEAVTIALFSGIILGTLAAVKRSRWQDSLAMILAVVGISVPNFIMATFLQYLFSMKMDLLPVARWGSLVHSILPALSLAALPTAFIARLTRANMVEVLEQDYVQTARSKGLSTRQVVLKHVLKNSLFPVLTYLGPLTSAILTGSFIVEKIFGIPGLGGWFVNSITNRDYTVIMGVTVFYSALLMLCVLAVDLMYTIIDPRMRFENQKKVEALKESDVLIATPPPFAESLPEKGVSYWKDAWIRLQSNRPAIFGLTVLVIMIGSAIIVPFFSPHTYYETHLALKNQCSLCYLLVWN